jgi:hypothetical protein
MAFPNFPQMDFERRDSQPPQWAQQQAQQQGQQFQEVRQRWYCQSILQTAKSHELTVVHESQD